MKIFITGGAGFIGTNLVERMSGSNTAEIIVYDNLSNPSGDLRSSTNMQIIEGDILDADKLKSAMAGCDAVVHLAAHTRVMESIEAPKRNLETNIWGTFNVLEAMRANGVKRIINASTGGAILGEVPPPVHEDMVPRPTAPYGASKLAAEGLLSAYSACYGITALSLRFSNIYGGYSRNKGSVVAHFIKQIVKNGAVTVYGDGTQTRDFLFVGDLSEGIEKAINSDYSGVAQLGFGKPTSVNELIDILREVLPIDFNVAYEDFRAGEIKHTYCAISRAQAAFGYAPSVELPEGVARTWAWFDQKVRR